MTESVFAKYEAKAYPNRYEGTLLVHNLAGGTPMDPKVAEAWLKTKVAEKDDIIRAQVAELMVERGLTAEEAVEQADLLKHLVGFRRDPERGLFMEGRHVKAAIKEAVSVAVAAGKVEQRGWGATKKWLGAFTAEHVCVVEDRIYLGANEPTGTITSFPKGRFGTGIQHTEYVEDAKIDFTVKTDWDFPDEWWAMVWLTGEEQGIGASRSQGFGRYKVVRWEQT